jgi:ABC-type oligopeptide transport system ATPase subunit
MAALVELRGVVKHFPDARTLVRSRGRHPAVHALDGVSFDVGGRCRGAGANGCGKTTWGR